MAVGEEESPKEGLESAQDKGSRAPAKAELQSSHTSEDTTAHSRCTHTITTNYTHGTRRDKAT